MNRPRFDSFFRAATGTDNPPGDNARILSPAERVIIDELVTDGLSIQEYFKQEPVYKQTGHGYYESVTVEDICRAKENLNKSNT